MEQCNHDSSKADRFVFCTPTKEVFMCECGVLIDILADKNSHDPIHPMTPDELKAAIAEIRGRLVEH